MTPLVERLTPLTGCGINTRANPTELLVAYGHAFDEIHALCVKRRAKDGLVPARALLKILDNVRRP